MDKMKQAISQLFEMTSIIFVPVFLKNKEDRASPLKATTGKRLEQTLHQRSYPNGPKHNLISYQQCKLKQ